MVWIAVFGWPAEYMYTASSEYLQPWQTWLTDSIQASHRFAQSGWRWLAGCTSVSINSHTLYRRSVQNPPSVCSRPTRLHARPSPQFVAFLSEQYCKSHQGGFQLVSVYIYTGFIVAAPTFQLSYSITST